MSRKKKLIDQKSSQSARERFYRNIRNFLKQKSFCSKILLYG